MGNLSCLECLSDCTIVQTHDVHYCTDCNTVEGGVVMLEPFHNTDVLVDEKGNLWDYDMVIVGSVID